MTGIAQPPTFFDDGYDGSWADALQFPHSCRILDDAPRHITEPDGPHVAPAIEYRPHAPFTPTLASGGNGQPPEGTSDGGTTGICVSLRMAGTGEPQPRHKD